MKKQSILILIMILSALSILGTSNLLSPVHGATNPGTVCISPSLTTCPQNFFTFNATSGKTLSVNITAQNSASTNSIDISVKADETILSAPTDTTGYSVSSNFGVVAQVCINGIIVVSSCSPTDGPGIVHIVAGGFSPVSGNFSIFTIHYNVLATTTGTPITYQTGCTGTSTSDGTTCVTVISDITTTPDPENVETADFTNLTPSANYVEKPTTGGAPLSVTFDASQSKPTTSTTNTIVSYNWDFGDGTTANVTTAITTHTYAVGTYTPKLYVVDSGSKRSETKIGVPITALPPDFTIVANPHSLALTTGGPPQNTTISLKSINGFSGTISLSVKVNSTLANAPTATLNQTSVTLVSGQTTHTTQLSVTAGVTTPAGGYAANVTAMSGILVHFYLVNFTVTAPDFTISAVTPSVTIPQGGTYGFLQVQVGILAKFNGTVAFSTVVSSQEILASVTPSSQMINTTDTLETSTVPVAVLSGALPGMYSVTVIGKSTPQPHEHNVTITIIVPRPDFVVTASPSSLSMQAGTSSNATIILTGIKGYITSSPITLTSNSSSALGITTTPTPSSVSITTTNGFAAATLVVNSGATTPAGTYTITVKASDGTNTHTQNITLTVTAPVASVQLGQITLSTTTSSPGDTITMNVTVTNTRAGSVNITVFMKIYSGSGSNLTVDSKTIILTNTQPQTVTLTWDTHGYLTGTYRIYGGISSVQTANINQSANAGNVALATPVQQGINLGGTMFWIAIAEAAGIVVLAILVVLSRRRPTVTV